jgi:hypothetical protein
MILEIHDNEVGNTLAGQVNNIDYDYMAEQWVQDLVSDESKGSNRQNRLDKMVLKDDLGVRAVWKIHENLDAELIEKSDRFRGEWVLNLPFSPR